MSAIARRPRAGEQALLGAEITATPGMGARQLQGVDLLLPGALALWAVSVRSVNPEAMNDFGLVAALPVTFFLATAALVFSAAIVLAQSRLSPVRLVLHLVALVLVLHATVPLILTAPNYPWVYKHIGVVAYINLHGRLDTSVDIYQNWPGFFALGAWFTKIAGVSSPLAYVAWAPVYFNLLACLGLNFVSRSLSLGARTRWLSLFLFVAGNWVGQDYFSPQAMALVLSLGVFGMVLAWMQADRPVAAMRAGRRLARWLARADLSVPASDLLSAPRLATRPRTAGLLSVLAVFATIVVTHQLSPYMVIAGVGLLSALGLMRPRWMALAFVALAGGYLVLRLPYLQRTQDIFGSLLDPFDNVKGNGVAASPATWGRRLTALAAPAMLAGTWALGLFGVVRRLRAGRSTGALAILAASPVLLAAGQSYGGEAVFRIYLFSLPWIALLGAAAFEARSPRPTRAAGAIAGAVIAVEVALFMSSSFGAEELYRVRPGALAASGYFYAHAQPKSILILGASQFPSRVAANYDQFVPNEPPNLLTSVDGLRHRMLGEEALPAVASFMAGYAVTAPGGSYLALTTDQDTYASVLGLAPAGSLPSLDRALGRSVDWQLFYRNRDAVIYRFLGPLTGDSRPPDRPVPTVAVPTPDEGKSDPLALGVGLAGLVALALAMTRRHTRTSVPIHIQQEETMDLITPTEIGHEDLSVLTAPGLEPHAQTDVAPSAAAEEVLSGLEHPSPSIRLAALKGLNPAAADVERLLRMLDDDLDAEVRAAVVRVIATQAPGEGHREALAVALVDPSPLVRATAIEHLATGEAGDMEALVHASEDADPGVRRAVYRRLATSGVPVQWATMKGSASREERRAALQAEGPDQLADRAQDGMRSPLAEERVFAVELAARAGTPECVALVTSAVDDADATVRRTALAQLRGRVESTSVIVGAMQDPEATVRLEAARTLDSVEHDEAVVGLVAGLGDLDAAVRQVCIDALVSRSSAGLARRVAAGSTSSNGGSVEEVLLRMGPAGRKALAASIRHDAVAAAETAAAELLEAARARVATEAVAIREAARAEAQAAARSEIEADRSTAMADARRRALEEAASIRRDAMADGERMRSVILEDALRHANVEAERIRDDALAEAEALLAPLRRGPDATGTGGPS